MKKLIALIFLAALAFGGWKVFNRPVSTKPERIPSVAGDSVVRAERRDLDSVLKLNGDVTPAVEVIIKPEVGGKVKAIHTSPGEKVNRGDLLLEIDDTDLLTDKNSAETDIEGSLLEVEKYRRNFQRAENLFKAHLISRELYDNTKSELEISENRLQKSRSRLQTVEDRLIKTRILAPTDGTVLEMDIIEGQVVTAAASVSSGTPLMTVANLTRLIINTHVNQVDIAHVKPHSQARFISEAIGKDVMKCSINFIAPIASIKNNIKGFEVEALIEAPDPRLRPGMTVTVTLDIARAVDAVTVPISAVFNDREEGDVVYVKQGLVSEKRKVTVGVTSNMFAEILTGIEVGDEVLLAPPKAQRS